MKTKLLFIAFSVCFMVNGFAQYYQPIQMGFNYVFTAPAGGMKQNIRNANGFVANMYWMAPSQRVSAGFEINFSGYGTDMSTQDYEFDDGTIAPMNVRVNNNFTTYTGNLRLYLFTKGLVRPYTEFRAGYASFNTKLTILDPNDLDSCEPVDTEMLKKDGTGVYGAGGGVRIDLAAFSKHGKPGRAFLDFSINATQGGRVNYMNVDAPSNNQQHTTTRTNDVMASFVNNQTQVVHKHHVGYVYNSYIQATDFRLGLTFSLGNYRSLPAGAQ